MAQSGSEIFNPRTGQRTRFLQTAADTGGKLLRIETFHPPHGAAEPEHVHPFQQSRCEVVSGTLCFRIEGNVRSAGPGESVDIPANVPHYFWNESGEEVHAVQEFRPAMKTEDFFDTYFALARAGKLNEKGLPNLLHMAVIMREYDQEIRVLQPPRLVQKLLMWTLTPIGRLLGYRGTYG